MTAPFFQNKATALGVRALRALCWLGDSEEFVEVHCDDVSVSISNNTHTHDAVPASQHIHQDEYSETLYSPLKFSQGQYFLATFFTDYLARARFNRW
jgi:hypothetical protein